MAEHKYQLVIQFPADTQVQLSDLLALEEQLEEAFTYRADAIVDGHDFGLGEFNIFIHTDEAVEVFEEVGKMIGRLHPELPFSAGYRAFCEDTYTSLYPRCSTTFMVL